MAIEQWLLTPDCKEVLEIKELPPKTKVVLSHQDITPPYNKGRYLFVDSPDRIEEHFLGAENGSYQWVDGWTKEHINTAYIADLDKDGNIITFRWTPSLYGEDGLPSSSLIPTNPKTLNDTKNIM